MRVRINNNRITKIRAVMDDGSPTILRDAKYSGTSDFGWRKRLNHED